MRSLVLFFTIACLGKAVAGCSLAKEKSNTETVLILRNDLVEARILPAHSGNVSSFKLRQADLDLLEPFEESVLNVSPLVPVQIIANAGGYADWLWNQHHVPRGEFACEILQQSDKTISVRLTGHIGSWQVSRTVSLADGSSILVQQITFTNEGAESAEFDYWAHLSVSSRLFCGGDGKWLIVPASSNRSPRKDRNMEIVANEGMQAYPGGPGAKTFAPAEAWIGRVSASPPGTLLLRCHSNDLAPDGFLYQWQGQENATLEMVMGRRRVSPGQSASFTVELAGAAVGEIPAAVLSNALLYVQGGRLWADALAPVNGTFELAEKKASLWLPAGHRALLDLTPIAGNITLQAGDLRETAHFQPPTPKLP